MGGKSFAGTGFIKSLYQTYASGKLRNSLTNLILEKNVDEIVASVFIGRSSSTECNNLFTRLLNANRSVKDFKKYI